MIINIFNALISRFLVSKYKDNRNSYICTNDVLCDVTCHAGQVLTHPTGGGVKGLLDDLDIIPDMSAAPATCCSTAVTATSSAFGTLRWGQEQLLCQGQRSWLGATSVPGSGVTLATSPATSAG